ncbi:hypothetical protein [Halomonas sp. A11-A]|uniref:hypothetical protein n=1 Tax=Halomonas sp. A11-A TaxID=2183985 RepID=UPI000D70E62B|nr:hypothetical protein [Halomonas sp. A11-A]PWV82953.1 hypothetical protein DER72_101133 [Halomonas sp. A11-A]
MKVVSLEPGARRDACLARLCAAVHGTQAGLAPLVAFSGTRHLLFPAEAARLWALLDNKGRPLALALLVMDESGEGMAVTLAASLEESREPLRRLLRDLALNAPLSVTPGETLDEAFLEACGITRWVKNAQGERVGLAFQHPAALSGRLCAPLAFDESAVLRRFKQERTFFEAEKQAFVEGLADA